jgi:ABC-type nitrate/sulfonate/bicarbonate transport system substrate-binding protein
MHGFALLMAVRVILPDPANLQHMAFWVARGAGLFAREGVDVTLAIPSSPGGVYQMVLRDDAEAAVLPPPVYLDLISQHAPIRLVANLLRNEPANLVVRRSAVNVPPDAPLGERLRALRGVKIGVAPGPVGRLRALFASEGLVADDVAQLVSLGGPEQNDAFAKGRVDALFAHTPYLEKALVEQDAVLWVHTSAGVPAQLASRQIHALCVRNPWAESHPSEVVALVRALAAAEQLIHRDQRASVEAILHEFPNRDRASVERIVAIYEPAIPTTPEVSIDGIRGALALFPSSRPPPDLSGIDLKVYVENPAPHRWRIPKLVAMAILAILVGILSVRIRRGSRPRKAASSG